MPNSTSSESACCTSLSSQIEVEPYEFAPAVDHRTPGTATRGIGIGEEIQRNLFRLHTLRGIEDYLRNGERLLAGVLLDHTGKRGERRVRHAVAWHVTLNMRQADAQSMVGIGCNGLAGVGQHGPAPLGANLAIAPS